MSGKFNQLTERIIAMIVLPTIDPRNFVPYKSQYSTAKYDSHGELVVWAAGGKERRIILSLPVHRLLNYSEYISVSIDKNNRLVAFTPGKKEDGAFKLSFGSGKNDTMNTYRAMNLKSLTSAWNIPPGKYQCFLVGGVIYADMSTPVA